MTRGAVCSIVIFYSALAASNRENMSRSRRGRANSAEVWGQQKHSGDGRSWRIDDDLEATETHVVQRAYQLEVSDRKQTRYPFYGRGCFHVARAWRLVGGCRVCLNGEGAWNLPLCKETQLHGAIDSSLKLNDDVSFHHLFQLTLNQ